MRHHIVLFAIAILLSSCYDVRMARIPEMSYTPLFAKDNRFEYNTNVSTSNQLSINAYLKFLDNAFIGGSFSRAKNTNTEDLISFGCFLWCGPEYPEYENYQRIYSGSLGLTDLLKKDITLMVSLGQRQNDIRVDNIIWYGPEEYRFARTSLSLYRNHAFKKTGGGFQYGFTTSRERVTFSHVENNHGINDIHLSDVFGIDGPLVEKGDNIDSFVPFVKLNLGGRRFTFNTALSYEFTNKKLSPLSPLVITTGITFCLGGEKKQK